MVDQPLASAVQRHQFFVLDTSFLVDCNLTRYWTLEPFKAIQMPNSAVVIPHGVGNEYHSLMNGFEPGDKYEEGSREAMNLLNLKVAFDYRRPLRNTLAEKLDQEVGHGAQNHSALSRTDKTIVQATLDIANKGDSVAVVSADWAIVYEIGKLRDETDVDISIYSPWRSPVKQEGIDFLISGLIFEGLPEIKPNGSKTPYLAVARGMDIGREISYDIAFAIYHKRFVSNMPKIGGIDFVRMFECPGDEYNQSTIVDMVAMFERNLFAVYHPDYPHSILVVRQGNKSLTPAQRYKLLGISRGKKLTASEVERFKSTFNTDNLKLAKWARVEDDDVKRHQKVTLGKFDELREKLASM